MISKKNILYLNKIKKNLDFSQLVISKLNLIFIFLLFSLINLRHFHGKHDDFFQTVPSL